MFAPATKWEIPRRPLSALSAAKSAGATRVRRKLSKNAEARDLRDRHAACSEHAEIELGRQIEPRLPTPCPFLPSAWQDQPHGSNGHLGRIGDEMKGGGQLVEEVDFPAIAASGRRKKPFLFAEYLPTQLLRVGDFARAPSDQATNEPHAPFSDCSRKNLG
jgi:hypothetical protein